MQVLFQVHERDGMKGLAPLAYLNATWDKSGPSYILRHTST
jgi:hypothetical protein